MFLWKRFHGLGVLVLLVLVGCSNSDSNSEPTQTPAETAAQIPDICQQDALGCTMIPTGETVKIAIAAPLTGDSASIGLSFSQATQIAIDKANQTPISGFMFSQIDENDGGTGEGGAAAAQRLVEVQSQGLVAVVGHAFSGASREAIPIYEAAGIPMMSPSATNPSLTQNGSRVFNRVVFNDNAQGVLMANYLYKVLNIRRLALMFDETIYSTELARVAKEAFVELGGEVVIETAIVAEQDNYLADLTAIAAAEPEALFFPGYTPEVAVVLNQLEEAGLGEVIFAASDGVNTQTLIELTGDNSEGVYTSGEAEPTESEQKAAFAQAHQARFGVEPETVSRAIWSAYDAASVLIMAVRDVAVLGDDGNLYIPRDALVTRVRNTQNYEGTSGLIDCDDTGECNTGGPDILVIQNGEGVTVPLDSLRDN